MAGVVFLSPVLPLSPFFSGKLRHPSQVAGEIEAGSYIRLKSGVSLIQRGENFLLTLPSRAMLLTEAVHVLFARNFDGRRSTQQIAKGLFCEVEEIRAFASLLTREGFADEARRPPALPTLDLSQEIIATRTSIESSLVTHRAGSVDGGQREILAREEATILISGENRLARHLLVALKASGFTNTRLISRTNLPPRLDSSDLCGVVVRASDIGKLRRDFTEELSRGAQLSRTELVAKAAPDLIISTIPIEWDYVQRWMSEGSTHLHLNQVLGHEIEIGPLVIPGETPCLRCIALIKEESGAGGGDESIRREAPSAVSAYISGLITLALAQYFATGSTPLRASSHWYDLLEPLRAPEVRHWNFHPECGCN